MKRKMILTLCVVAILVLIAGMLPARIDCGASERYTPEERKTAANLVADTVKAFDGCRLFLVKYDGDDISLRNLDYCNELAPDDVQYTDCMVFTSCFRSPIFHSGAWNPNEIYSWSWYLARPKDGSWEIVTCGYA